MSLRLQEYLALTPTGKLVQELSLDEMSRYLRDQYYTDQEKQREEEHRLRDKLYRDGGVDEMHNLIDTQYSDDLVKQQRKGWAKHARFNNVTKRIVNELSVVYQEPATRLVGGDADNVNYQLILSQLRIHERARLWNRMLNLHRAVLAGPRVRFPNGADAPEREIVLDVVTPANARLITHPNDAAQIVGHAVRIRPRSADGVVDDKPSWIVYTDRERFMMTEDWKILSSTLEENELGRMPYVFVSLEPPCDSSPWPGSCGSDLTAGDMAIWFVAVSLIKETKSATNQTIFSGDGTGLMRGQTMDTETPMHVPDGMAVTSQDMSMDLSLFRDTADHILEHLANNYGMSAALIKHQGTQSAEARELMRVPLKELRREQQVILRRFERELAESIRAMVEVHMPEMAFSLDGWRIDFAESETPLTPKEELERFEHENRLGLTSVVKYAMQRNPDIQSKDDAKRFIKENSEERTWHNETLREFQAASGADHGRVQQMISGDADQERATSDDDSDGRDATPAMRAIGNGR